jgi:hypothetical protein
MQKQLLEVCKKCPLRSKGVCPNANARVATYHVLAVVHAHGAGLDARFYGQALQTADTRKKYI